jgi:hypothetical protein
MSEYQYYEFLALDRPLTREEMAALRSISSRAVITPTSFTNHYEWGDLKADPLELLRRYFDVFVYVANWGTRWVALRIPKDALPLKTARPFLPRKSDSVREAGDVVLLSLSSEDEEMEGWDEGTGWMASLAPVRSELLRGDLRPLYLAWLANVQEEELADDEREPMLPPGLGSLSPAQMRLAEFLRVDPFLLSVAAEGSADVAASTEGIEDWIATLSVAEKLKLLASVAIGEGASVGASLMRRFQATRAAPPATARRTVGSLLGEAHRRREEHVREQARLAEARRQQEAEAEARRREMRLAALAERQDAAWDDVERLIAIRQRGAYEDAVALLADLRAVAERTGGLPAFAQRLGALRERHARKLVLMERLREARLTG